jgi:hypothetical protein
MLSLGNKLTLNTQPIYKFVNKYSIDFDGVDDRIITDGADTMVQILLHNLLLILFGVSQVRQDKIMVYLDMEATE